MHDRMMVLSGILVEVSLFGAAAAYPAPGTSHVGTIQGGQERLGERTRQSQVRRPALPTSEEVPNQLPQARPSRSHRMFANLHATMSGLYNLEAV